MTTAVQQTALEKPSVAVVFFAEFQFRDGTSRVSSFNMPFEWNGHEWQGLGTLGSISAVDESESLESSAVNFTLNVAQEGWLALAVGSVEEYRGRNAKLWMGILNSSFGLIGDPILVWRGVMDQMLIDVGADGDSKITMKCETSAYGLKRSPSLRMNAAQQKKRHPSDTGFDYLTALIMEPKVWLTRRFQEI